MVGGGLGGVGGLEGAADEVDAPVRNDGEAVSLSVVVGEVASFDWCGPWGEAGPCGADPEVEAASGAGRTQIPGRIWFGFAVADGIVGSGVAGAWGW